MATNNLIVMRTRATARADAPAERQAKQLRQIDNGTRTGSGDLPGQREN